LPDIKFFIMNSTLIIIFQLFLSLSILVVLHELGHFLAARYFGTKVDKFYLFFNPGFSLFKKKIGDTEYGIGWLPLGGYVKIAGMIDESMDKDFLNQEPQPWEFRSKPAWQRLIIMLAGVIVNILLAIVIYIGLAYAYGEQLVPMKSLKGGLQIVHPALKEAGLKTGDKILKINNELVEYANTVDAKLIAAKEVEVNRNGEDKIIHFPVNFVEKLVEGKSEGYKTLTSIRYPFIVENTASNINKDKLEKGDQIVAINGQKAEYLDEIKPLLEQHKGEDIQATVLRNGQPVQVNLKVDDTGKLGVQLNGDFKEWEKRGYVQIVNKKYGFLESIPAGLKRTKETFLGYIDQLKMIFNPKTGAYKGVGGFISIAKIFPDTWDWARFWTITAFLSIMLAVLNVLPIPALDGGHAMFTLYEMITGRKPNEKFLEYAQIAGFILLLALVLLVNGNDVIKNFFK
jgi:regulator of sigma E protease